MKIIKLPPIGLRNAKTAIAVFICLILLKPNPFFAAIASVICMQDTVEHSVKVGTNRLIGTLIGGVFGTLLLYFTNGLNLNLLNPLITACGVSFVIYISNIIKKPTACAIASLVLIAIMIAPEGSNPIIYASSRTIETAIGILVAISVNKFIVPLESNDTNINS